MHLRGVGVLGALLVELTEVELGTSKDARERVSNVFRERMRNKSRKTDRCKEKDDSNDSGNDPRCD